jgi:HEAT repeat protein
MMTSLLAPIVLLGQLAAAPADPPASTCARCGADVTAIARLVDRLQTAHLDLARYQAVVALRRFDVHCHPEIVPPLIGALQHDREDAVRAEAAISLAKLGANRPDVVAALRQAADRDRLTVRIRANWSLRRLAR